MASDKHCNLIIKEKMIIPTKFYFKYQQVLMNAQLCIDQYKE